MGVQGLGEDKKNISPEIQAFPTTRPLFTGDGVSPAGEAVVAGAMTDLCPSKRGVPWQEFLMACENTQGSTHYYIQLLINITIKSNLSFVIAHPSHLAHWLVGQAPQD